MRMIRFSTVPKLLFFIALGFARVAYGSNFYVSASSGNDARSAAEAGNSATPWKSVERVNAHTNLQPGDTVFFHRGEVFFGSLNVNARGTSARPIVYSAYGTGKAPVITSFMTLTQWTPAGNGIYESTVDIPGQELNMVLINSVVTAVGRYPNRDAANGGYLQVESHSGKTSIRGKDFTGSPDFTGAEVVIRKNHWIIDRHRITAQSGALISYDSNNSVYEATDRFGFFIQRHIKTLDRFGEWYHDASRKKLSVFFGNTAPQNTRVEVSLHKTLIQTAQNSGMDVNVVFEGLVLRGSNETAVLLNSGNNITLRNCHVEFAGKNGIEANGVARLTVTGCSVLRSNNNGIVSIWNNPNTLLEGNRVDSTCMFPGMVQSGDGNGLAIFCVGKNSIIRKNTVTNTGYIGIHFGGDGVQVMNNLVDGFCMIKDDGSGIYTYTGAENRNYTGRVIAGNIVLNGTGAVGGSENGYLAAEGIYLDDNVSGISITGNTVAHIANAGLYIHNARNLTISNNLIYNAKMQVRLSHDGLGDPVSNVSLTGNTFFARSSGQTLVSISTIRNDLGGMMRLDSNNYARPMANTGAFIRAKYLSPSGEVSADYDLEKWKADWGQDRSSQKCSASLPEFRTMTATGANKIINGSFDQSITGIEAWSPTNRIRLNWSAGRALEVVASGLAYTMIPVGTVNSAKTYVLRFDQVANKASVVNVYLRQRNAPYQTLSEIKSFTGTTATGKMQMLLKPSADEADCVLVIETKDTDVVYALDNIDLTESTVGMTDPDSFIRFEYNAADAGRNITLNGLYITPANQVVKGSQSIGAYGSGIYVWKESMGSVTPPVVVCDDQKNTITASHSTVGLEIQVSENGGAYRPYTGLISVGNVNRPEGYWKFRIAASASSLESDVMSSQKFTQEISVKPVSNVIAVFPNPATSVTNLAITTEDTGSGTLSIYNFKGYKVLELPVSKTTREYVRNLNVSHFKPGLYIVVIRVNGKMLIGKMVKV